MFGLNYMSSSIKQRILVRVAVNANMGYCKSRLSAAYFSFLLSYQLACSQEPGTGITFYPFESDFILDSSEAIPLTSPFRFFNHTHTELYVSVPKQPKLLPADTCRIMFNSNTLMVN
jgi:hypothetical protein